MRRLITILVALGIATPAIANPDADKATALLEQVAKAPTADARLAAAKSLAELAPHAIEPLGVFLARTRTTTVEDRRIALQAIGAQVPDKKGTFATPNREKDKQMRAGDDLDWLAALVKADLTSPVIGEITADIAAIRALAATKDVTAAPVIFDTAFAADSMVYRDECGRQLRAMAPYSIPGLIRAAVTRGALDRKRYANYQLERIDRQEPGKALTAAADDEDLEIAIITAFKDTKHREAVAAVLSKIDDDAPRVRAIAREAWMAYVTGPPPPPAPKKKLQLPGGRLTDKEMPLWFTSRELADQFLRKQADELFGEIYGERDKLNLEEMSKRIFAHHDAERAKRDGVLLDEARKQRDAGNLPEAIALFDRLLVTDVNRAEKTEMAKGYLAHADALGKAGKWPEAAAAYSKAHGLDPGGDKATHALAAQYYATGKALEAEGKDGGAQFRKAAALEPNNETVQEAAEASSGKSGPTWMLLAGGSAAVLAAVFLGVGVMRRRAAS